MTLPNQEIDRSQAKVGPIWLSPGVKKIHCWALFYASLTTIAIVTLMHWATNYVIWVNLGIPQEEWGTINGDLGFWTEVTQIVLFTVIGVGADRIGRRPIFVFGMLSMGVGYALYPFAESLTELTGFRIIFAVGLACASGMLTTVLADYPQNVSRGKMLAIVGVLNGVGIVGLTSIVSRMPDWFKTMGMDAIEAGRYTHFMIFALCAFSAVLLGFTLKAGTPKQREERPSIGHLLKAGIKEGKKPRIALSYAAAFVARSDLVVLGTFTVTWGMAAGFEMGLSPAEASKQGNLMTFVVCQIAALFWAPVAGFMLDKVNRVIGLGLCMLLACIGYCGTYFVDNPLDPSSIPFFILLGIGQISAFLGAFSLIGQEAPEAERGSVMGMFSMIGAIGILVATSVGGRLFDQVAPWAPFVLIGVANGVLFIAALLVNHFSPEEGFDATGSANQVSS